MTQLTNGGWIESLPAVDIELLENGNVRVTDKSGLDEEYSVDLHPIQLRLIAEKLGLVGAMSNTEADALRTVDKLARRLALLHDRINELDDYLLNNSDHAHADLNWEIQFSRATYELSSEFQREIEESRAVVTPLARQAAPNPTAPARAKPGPLPLFPEGGAT